jgi:hypothetical protein
MFSWSHGAAWVSQQHPSALKTVRPTRGAYVYIWGRTSGAPDCCIRRPNDVLAAQDTLAVGRSVKADLQFFLAPCKTKLRYTCWCCFCLEVTLHSSTAAVECMRQSAEKECTQEDVRYLRMHETNTEKNMANDLFFWCPHMPCGTATGC